MTDYNYKTFPLDADMQDFQQFPNIARVGTKAPDGILLDAKDGSEVQLAQLYKRGLSVIEFGSFT